MRDFYLRDDVTQIAQELLGKVLVTQFNQVMTAGKIVETEAYCGSGDRACHANNGRRTKRNEVMYGVGGHAYVYLCYGLHHLFNVVTNVEGKADAVLIRAVEPLDGVDIMLQRRGLRRVTPQLCAGPATLTVALGIRTKHNRHDLLQAPIYLEDRGFRVAKHEIVASPRVGVSYAGTDSSRPWRYRIKNHPWTSPAQ